MQRLEVSGAVRPIYGSLGVKQLNTLSLVQFIINYKLHNSVYEAVKTT